MARSPVLPRARHSSSGGQVLIRVSPTERRRLEPRLDLTVGRFADSDDAFISSLQSDVRSVVWEIESGVTRTYPRLRSAVLDIATKIPLVIRSDLHESAVQEFDGIAARAVDCRFSVPGIDDLASQIDAMASGQRDDSACRVILARWTSDAPSLTKHIGVAAVIAGRRRMGVRSFADACRRPLRTLEWRLRCAGTLPPAELLALCTCLHAAWRLDVLGWTPKRTAIESRFSNSAALGNFLERHTGMRPREIVHRKTFDDLLERFESLAFPIVGHRVVPSGEIATGCASRI